MTLLAVLCLGVLLYTFIGYPFILAALAFFFGKQVKKNENFEPSVSLIISAYNEERVIEDKLLNSLELDYPKDKLEIIVASESIDGTHNIVRNYKNRGIKLITFEKREGKRATLFKTVPLAQNEIVVFSDANAIYKNDAIRKIVRNFSDPRIGCVSGQLKYINKNDSNIGKGESTYWNFEVMLKKLLSRLLILGGGVNGSIFAVRRELYMPIDKFRGDDFEVSAMVEIAGRGVILESEALSFEESSETSKQEFKRKVRLASWNMMSCLLLLSRAIKNGRVLTAFILFSHRFLRYTTPIWLICLFISNLFLLEKGWLYFFILQLFMYSIAMIGFLLEQNQKKVKTVFLIPYYFCVMNAAALVALFKNIFGRSEMLWEKVR